MNNRIVLAARPQGFPKDSDFRLEQTPVPSPADGEILVAVRWLSVDPYMRGRMNETRSYADPVKLGDVMVGGAAGRVLESRNAKFAAGDYVMGMFGWQEYAVSDGQGVRKLDPSIAPVSTSLGVLGMPGLTAYFGLLTVGQPKPGETVLVSGAAGAVGSYVGQIARIHGCRVVGIAGSDEKTRWLKEDLGFDAVLNYRSTSDYRQALAALCPNGIDVYFDNVGGAITDAAFTLLNPRARVPICGQISQYNAEKPEMGPRLLSLVLVRQVKVEGFLVFQFADRYAEGLQKLTEWVRAGQLKYKETVTDGIENAPQAFLSMLAGGNTGKQLVRIGNRDTD
ncbi:MAG: NADP-dependent oxidoreductase [Bryobacterales bacterium]|nr:NADP-dependent oxidoreductase [Bryobacterales bacterium]